MSPAAEIAQEQGTVKTDVRPEAHAGNPGFKRFEERGDPHPFHRLPEINQVFRVFGTAVHGAQIFFI